MKKIITGNQAVAYGVMLSHVDVISAYPITPQTTNCGRALGDGRKCRLEGKFLKVESEHSAMARDHRSFHRRGEGLHSDLFSRLAYMARDASLASGGRLPIVMANVNRALGPGWNIWNDQSDSVSQRDTGWIQLYLRKQPGSARYQSSRPTGWPSG